MVEAHDCEEALCLSGQGDTKCGDTEGWCAATEDSSTQSILSITCKQTNPTKEIAQSIIYSVGMFHLILRRKNKSRDSEAWKEPRVFLLAVLDPDCIWDSQGRFLKNYIRPWPGGSVGWSTVPCTRSCSSIPGQGTHLSCGFNPQSGRKREATNQYFSHIDVSHSFPLPLSLSL